MALKVGMHRLCLLELGKELLLKTSQPELKYRSPKEVNNTQRGFVLKTYVLVLQRKRLMSCC